MTQSVPDYLKWFHFKEQPFRMSPDPDFFFPSRAHKQAMDVLNYGISRGEGFMVLSGHAGTGKTMILKLLLEGMHQDKQAALIVTPAVSPKGLLSLLLEELGVKIPSERSELALLLKDFQEHILGLAKTNRGLLIVVDEAQDLPLETVEQLRLLSNIETGKKKLVQILLVGQPEIKNLLADPRLCQLTQRIVINEELSPLDEQETRDYVRFRLSRAGRPDLPISKGFMAALYKRTRGLPRLINRAMDRTLLMAAAAGSRGLNPAHIEQALSTLPEPGIATEARGFRDVVARFSPGKNLAFGAAGCLLGIGLCFLILGTELAPNVSNLTNESQAMVTEKTSHKHLQKGIPGVVSVKSARIHIMPSKRSAVLTIARSGSRIMVLEEKGRWYKVMTRDKKNGAVTGWLLKTQVERSFSAAYSLSEKKDMGRRHYGQRTI